MSAFRFAYIFKRLSRLLKIFVGVFSNKIGIDIKICNLRLLRTLVKINTIIDMAFKISSNRFDGVSQECQEMSLLNT